MEGRIFVISGPSGAGKTSIIEALKGRVKGLGYSISHTSRTPRRTEQNGVDYHFVTRESFLSMIEAKAFVEWAEVYGNFYGTSFSNLNEQISKGLDVLLDIDSQGADNIRRKFASSILVYVLPPSLEKLEKRLSKRDTDDESTIMRRMETAVREINNCKWYDYIIINEDLESAIEEFKTIMLSDRCRTNRNEHRIKEIFGIPFP